ncbi:hypothetical protein GPALN_016196 [Globodera pallida]|nr:hypothetical protein GPALN_016196 [Globodera pallida]
MILQSMIEGLSDVHGHVNLKCTICRCWMIKRRPDMLLSWLIVTICIWIVSTNNTSHQLFLHQLNCLHRSYQQTLVKMPLFMSECDSTPIPNSNNQQADWIILTISLNCMLSSENTFNEAAAAERPFGPLRFARLQLV